MDKAYAGYCRAGYVRAGQTSLLLDSIIADLEEETIGSYCFEAGCVEPGIDNVDVPLRRILNNLKK